MERFQQLLREAFDSPYTWRWTAKHVDFWSATFKDKDDLKFDVEFLGFTEDKDGEIKTTWHVSFLTPERTNSISNTGKFDAKAVLSTIMSILKDFIEKVSPLEIKFSGDESEGKDKLYEMMIKYYRSLLKRWGFTSQDYSLYGSRIFVLSRKR